MMLPRNKILILVISCKSEQCLNLREQSIKTWIPLIDNKRYHVVFVDANNLLNQTYTIEDKQSYSILTLNASDDFLSLTIKMKKLFSFLKKNTNIPFYWILDHDTYVNYKAFNQFKDYGYDWYGSGPWGAGNISFVIGCGHYMSRKFIELASSELENMNHYYDISLGKLFHSNKNLRIKYSDNIHHNENGLEIKKIDNLLFGHKVYDMVKFHSLYK